MREMKDTPKGLCGIYIKGKETGQKVLQSTSKIGCILCFVEKTEILKRGMWMSVNGVFS